MPNIAQKALTTASLMNIRRPRRGQKEVADGVVRGLRYRISSTNVRSYVLSYRVAGKLTRKLIGYYPGMSLAEARRLAQEIKDGGSPAQAADTKKGMRPVFSSAAASELGKEFFEYLLSCVRQKHTIVDSW